MGASGKRTKQKEKSKIARKKEATKPFLIFSSNTPGKGTEKSTGSELVREKSGS